MVLTRRLRREDGPLWRQAAARLRSAIAAGRLKLGEPLPREAELATGFDVSLITVRHALRALEADGLIRKRPAKTAVVVSREPRLPAVRPLNSLTDIVAATAGARLDIFSYGEVRAAEPAAVFGLPPGTPLFCLRARLLLDAAPQSDIAIYFPPDIGQHLARADFDDVVVFRSVERRLGIKLAGASITVSAELADAGLARRLDYQVGGAILVSRMVYQDEAGRPVEMTIARARADRHRVAYAFSGR
jgi:GntR family transcriptional regulator